MWTRCSQITPTEPTHNSITSAFSPVFTEASQISTCYLWILKSLLSCVSAWRNYDHVHEWVKFSSITAHTHNAKHTLTYIYPQLCKAQTSFNIITKWLVIPVVGCGDVFATGLSWWLELWGRGMDSPPTHTYILKSNTPYSFDVITLK